MNIDKLKIDGSWSLFLDRDGVINKRLMGDYVKSVVTFDFLPGVLEAVSFLSNFFETTVIVTNQQGIGKGLMSAEDLNKVHTHLLKTVELNKGHINKVYFAPQLAKENSTMRKPNTGMALQAQDDFPSINFEKSIMVGDTLSDMAFGKNAGMVTVLVGNESDESHPNIDFAYQDLYAFSKALQQNEQ